MLVLAVVVGDLHLPHDSMFYWQVTLIDSIGNGESGGTPRGKKPSGEGGGISRRRGRQGAPMSSVKLKHLRTIFDEAAGDGNGQLGADKMGHLLKDDLSTGHQQYASVKRKVGCNVVQRNAVHASWRLCNHRIPPLQYCNTAPAAWPTSNHSRGFFFW